MRKRPTHSEAVAEEFAEHAREEQEHADWLTKRIGQLNGVPDHNPATLLERSHSEYVECDDLMDMIKENLVAERIAIDSYSESSALSAMEIRPLAAFWKKFSIRRRSMRTICTS